MPEFKYRGVIKNGKMIRGYAVAKNKHDIISKLKNSKISPIEIEERKVKVVSESKKKLNYERLNKISRDVQKTRIKVTGKNAAFRKKNFLSNILSKLNSDVSITRVKPSEVLTFTNSLYILKKAKFNNIAALEALFNSTENKKLKNAIEDILIDVQAGTSINESMEKFPKIFPPLYVNFVKVGEESGSLDIALMHARNYIESSTKLNKQIKGILLPKLLLFIGITLFTFAGLLYGVPLIENVYKMFGSSKTLPPITLFAIHMTKTIIKYWYIGLSGITISLIGFLLYVNTPIGKYKWDRFKLKATIFGSLNLKITTNKFLRAMLLNLKNGMKIQDSLESSKSVTGNYYFLSLVEAGKNNLLSGGSWLDPFKADEAFSNMVVGMIEIGMKTDLVEMMDKVEDYIQQEIDETIEKTVKALPEITYVFIGILLVFFVLTIMVPLIDVYMGGFLFETIK